MRQHIGNPVFLFLRESERIGKRAKTGCGNQNFAGRWIDFDDVTPRARVCAQKVSRRSIGFAFLFFFFVVQRITIDNFTNACSLQNAQRFVRDSLRLYVEETRPARRADCGPKRTDR
jgi:hypothetical protein